MRFTNWVREELMLWVAYTSLYGVMVPSLLFNVGVVTADALNIGAGTKSYETLKSKAYQIGAFSGLVGTITFVGSFTFLITDKRIQQNRILQSRLDEIERMNEESRELVKTILSQVPSNCKSCKYYTGDVYLLCSVHPTDMQSDCVDWQPNKINQL